MLIAHVPEVYPGRRDSDCFFVYAFSALTRTERDARAENHFDAPIMAWVNQPCRDSCDFWDEPNDCRDGRIKAKTQFMACMGSSPSVNAGRDGTKIYCGPYRPKKINATYDDDTSRPLCLPTQEDADNDERSSDTDSEGIVCAVCFERKRRFAIDDCGHFILCATCAIATGSKPSPTCPMCRVPIIKGFHVIFT